MNILDLIGNFVLSLYGAFLIFAKEVIEAVDAMIGSTKKKVSTQWNRTLEKKSQKLSTYPLESGITTQQQTKSSSVKLDHKENSELIFSTQNPLPGQDLLVKEGWTTARVHPVPETGQQVIILKDEKNNKGKMLGKEAFLEYLVKLNEKHNR
jgi:hypothetical protein